MMGIDTFVIDIRRMLDTHNSSFLRLVFVRLLILPLPYDEWAIFRHQVFSRCCTLDVLLYVVGLNSGTEVPTSLFQ